MSDSSDEPIGFVKPALTGVTVAKKAVLGSQLQAPVPKAFTGPVRNASLGPKVTVRGLPKAQVLVPEGQAQEPPQGLLEVPPPETLETPEATPQEAPQLTIAELTAPAPTAAPQETGVFTRPTFFGAKISNKLQDLIVKKPPVDITPPTYVPVSSTQFQDFMVHTYTQYSPILQKALREGPASITAEKTLDKDACKRRDPNKVETFYYQKLVRDYLQRSSPYRGLLVYHGLGSGKTCTSIAAAEALIWGGAKTIYVLTPATLSNNYKRELGKCGFFPLRTNNFWTFLPAPGPGLEQFWIINVLGLSEEYVKKHKGAWIPEPDKLSNWDSLSADQRLQIEVQQDRHLHHRFRFIHYNGVLPEILSQLAADGVARGKSMFDDAVVIIDEVHNLVRTINGSQIGGRSLGFIMENLEPREATWSTKLGRERTGFRYPRGYSLYRLLQNAVGAKIIALSATPMINYPQELAILMNLIGGEIRTAEFPLKTLRPEKLAELTAWCLKNPTIDYYAIEENESRESILTVTPVPHGFSKVVDETGPKGFTRGAAATIGPVETSRERNMEAWALTLLKALEADGFFTGVRSTELEADPKVQTTIFKIRTFPILPEDSKLFVDNFIDKATLKIQNANILKARASGLISYYRGGGDELMPRVIRNDIVKVDMSDFMFQEYTKSRLKELDMESPAEPTEGDGPKKPRKGMTFAEMDLYTQATKSQATGFLCLSRAACNWVFPTEVPRPDVTLKQKQKLLGLDQGRIIAANRGDPAEDPDAEAIEEVLETEGVVQDVVLADEAPAPKAPVDEQTVATITGLMSGLEAKAEQYLKADLGTYSKKYETMVTNIKASPGPALVYSQFKTLEGLGIFAAALRADGFKELDIVKVGGVWEIPEAIMVAGPKYILYTGDQLLEKRRLLLQLYNADLRGLPAKLATQCRKLLELNAAPDQDNRRGDVCRVFMITQSGAEGISLANTRQVHIMEPYWNNVRLQQVIGRAIRLCSHMNLVWEERTVEIFTYLSVFSAQQKAEGAKQLMMSDKSMTTDEMIFDIATKKQTLADGLFDIAQTAAIDCELHYHEHGAVTQCFKYPENERPMFMYHPDWRKDLQEAATKRGL